MDSSEAYFLAGRNLTAWVIAGSLVLTNLSAEHLIGLNADAFNHTIAVMAWETTAALAMVLATLYFLPRYLKIGLTTIPEFLARRFDNQTRFIAAVLFLFSYAVAILPVVLLFGSEIASKKLASNKSPITSGSLASCSTLLNTSISMPAGSSPSTTRLAQKCYPCLQLGPPLVTI